MKVSVVIATRGWNPGLTTLISSLQSQVWRPEEVIIVSCTVPPGDSDFLRGCPDFSVKIIWLNSRVASASLQRNIGAMRAGGDCLIFLDDDIVPVGREFVGGMVTPFFEEPGGVVGVSGSMINAPTRNSSGVFGVLKKMISQIFLISPDDTGKFSLSLFPSYNWRPPNRTYVEYAGLGAFAVKASVFRSVLLDSRLSGRSPLEEGIFSYILTKAKKLNIVVEPRALFWHPPVEVRSVERSAGTLIGYLYFVSEYILPNKPLRLFPFLWTLTGIFASAVFDTNKICGFFIGLNMYYKGICFVEISDFPEHRT